MKQMHQSYDCVAALWLPRSMIEGVVEASCLQNQDPQTAIGPPA